MELIFLMVFIQVNALIVRSKIAQIAPVIQNSVKNAHQVFGFSQDRQCIKCEAKNRANCFANYSNCVTCKKNYCFDTNESSSTFDQCILCEGKEDPDQPITDSSTDENDSSVDKIDSSVDDVDSSVNNVDSTVQNVTVPFSI